MPVTWRHCFSRESLLLVPSFRSIRQGICPISIYPLLICLYPSMNRQNRFANWIYCIISNTGSNRSASASARLSDHCLWENLNWIHPNFNFCCAEVLRRFACMIHCKVGILLSYSSYSIQNYKYDRYDLRASTWRSLKEYTSATLSTPCRFNSDGPTEIENTDGTLASS